MLWKMRYGNNSIFFSWITILVLIFSQIIPKIEKIVYVRCSFPCLTSV